MRDQVADLIIDESNWLSASMGIALLAVTVLLRRQRRSDLPTRQRVLAAMNLFFGVTIGTMAFGHLLAVTTKLASGTLEGSVPAFYLIGIALALPSWWIVHHTRRVLAPDGGHGRQTLGLNAWLSITLLAMGIQNLPLAAQGILNLAYQLHSGRLAGWAIVGCTVVLNVGLFFGSLIFMASGQSFEQFRGIR